jgi:DNA-binding IclR family transcriptional regulator
MSSPGTPRTQALARAVDVLHAVADRPSGSSASELGRAAGLPRSTVTRTLHTLADAGLVEETGSGAGWVLGHELVRLARAADPHRRLVEAARPALARLRDAAGESALLAVPRGRPGMEILLQLDANRHVGVADWVGVDVPLHASSAGKLVLAELDDDELTAWLDASSLASFTERTVTDREVLRAELARVRRQGWAELVDELEDGLTSISAPVRSRGVLVGIIGVSGPTFRLPRGRRRELVLAVRATASEIETALTRFDRAGSR